EIRPDEVTTEPSGRSSLSGCASAVPWSPSPMSMVLPGLFSPATTCASSLTGDRPRVRRRQVRALRVRRPPQRLVVPRLADAVALALGLLRAVAGEENQEIDADDRDPEPQQCLDHAHGAELT